MATKQNPASDLKTLKEDASRILEDITQLTRTVASQGMQQTDELASKLEEEIDALKDRLASLSDSAQDAAKQLAKHVRSNPYKYLLGAVGVGTVLLNLGRSKK